MFLRIAAVLTIVALLSEDSGATEIKSSSYRLGTSVGDDSNMLPGFSFTSFVSLLQKLFMVGSGGFLDGTQLEQFTNTTPWIIKNLSDSATSMTQTIQANTLGAIYNQTKTTMGLLTAMGTLGIDMSGSTFDMTLTATNGENGTCQLDIEMVLQKLNLDVDLSNLGLVGSLLQILLKVVSGLVTTITNVLSGVLASVLAVLLGEQLADTLNLDELCESLLNAGTNLTPPNIL